MNAWESYAQWLTSVSTWQGDGLLSLLTAQP